MRFCIKGGSGRSGLRWLCPEAWSFLDPAACCGEFWGLLTSMDRIRFVRGSLLIAPEESYLYLGWPQVWSIVVLKKV